MNNLNTMQNAMDTSNSVVDTWHNYLNPRLRGSLTGARNRSSIGYRKTWVNCRNYGLNANPLNPWPLPSNPEEP